MKLPGLLFFLTSMVFYTLACTADDLPPSQAAVSTPTELTFEMPTRMPFATQTPPPIIIPATPEPTPFPAWVTDFSDPILVSLTGRRPDFQDDFSLLNRGWFYDIPGSPIGPYYAHIGDGALILKLPDGNLRTDSMVYNPTLNRRNFVLSFDLRFGETQPHDYVSFQFNRNVEQNFTLELSKNKNWNFRWLFENEWKSITGSYDQFPPQRINVVFIVRGNECAVYLNHDPLDYSGSCISDSKLRSSARAVSFHLVAIPGNTALAHIDNVKMWDLDEYPVFIRQP